MIKLNKDGLLEKPLEKDYEVRVASIVDNLRKKQGLGSDFLGWVSFPMEIGRDFLDDIAKTGRHIRESFDVLVVCGIGGSYLGVRAVIDALNGIAPLQYKPLEIIYFGNTFSPTYTAQVLDYLKNKNFCVNVISKSGTTTETSLAFRLLKTELEKHYSKEELKDRIYVTTDKKKGLLRKLADKEGYKTFEMPDDIGGRYSVFTAVGLLPIAAAGLDIYKFIEGAKLAHDKYLQPLLKDNLAAQYAIVRNHLYKNVGKKVELYTVYEPHYLMLTEWLKQLFGESEGKEGKGLYPASVCYSTDLHSLGQFVQDGSPVLFETNIQISNPKCDVLIPRKENDDDELNYLTGKNMEFVNEKAFLGTKKAHVEEGKVNNLDIIIEKMDESTLGELLYFFMISCAISGYLLDINPFDQPGVEIYKKNMFELLGKNKK